MIDLAQAFVQRTVVRAHDRTWMVCYALLVTEEDRRAGRHFYLAVPCSDAGTISVPHAVTLICLQGEPSEATPR